MALVTKSREEIPEKYTWDLASIFPTLAEWEEAIERLNTQLSDLISFQGKLAGGPSVLAEFLETSAGMFRNVAKILTYASLHYSVDTGNQTWGGRRDRARTQYSRSVAELAFAEPELLEIGMPTLKRWSKEEERLAGYHHYFDQLDKQQAHIRSADVEQILGMVRDPLTTANSTHSIMGNADLKFKPAQGSDGESYEISQGTIDSLKNHADRQIRRTAYENYADAHLALKNSMANALAGGVKGDIFFARARNYENSLDASLSANFIPLTVFHNLIDTYKANLPTWHRYWAIRRQALGYQELHPYDIKAPLSRKPPRVPYETAVEWIAAGMQPLGSEYVSILRQGCLEERWIDVFPNEGKTMGAFSAGFKGTRPFILMSYAEDLFGLSTLAHELGHSLHSFYTWQTQTIWPYQSYSLFVAEVASNFNQALVRAHLLETNDDIEFQIAVIEEAMANFHRYFFIMPTLARFELEIHQRVEQGYALNADYLTQLMSDLFAEGFGDEVVIDRDRIGSTWAQFHSHLYANYYVYQYATGISAAHSLAQNILAQRTGSVENYLSFLKAGGSLYPLTALQLAGVDMNSPEPVETTFAILAGYVDRLEALLQRRTN